MRIWSLHPDYLTNRALSRCWEDARNAYALTCGRKVGGSNHPQYLRWGDTTQERTRKLIRYLHVLAAVATKRGAKMRCPAIMRQRPDWQPAVLVSEGQLQYEALLLLFKTGEQLGLTAVPKHDGLHLEADLNRWLNLWRDSVVTQPAAAQDSESVELGRKFSACRLRTVASCGLRQSPSVNDLDVEPWEHVVHVPLPCAGQTCQKPPTLTRSGKVWWCACLTCDRTGLGSNGTTQAAQAWNRSHAEPQWVDWLNAEIRRTAR